MSRNAVGNVRETDTMPVLFIGHGSPENAIENNEFTRNWKKIASTIPRPEAILCISAHWLREGSAITGMEKPRTIHDFYGFPEKLYRVKYDVKGSPEYAKRIKQLVKSVRVELDYEWGLDHGTWSVLVNMYPEADIPVLQLSLDYYLPLEKQFQIGRELMSLRSEGVLVIGSGNIVHNLMAVNFQAKPYDWAVDFDNFVKHSLETRDDDALINYARQKSASLAHPTNDHYLPLLYVIGASETEKPQFLNEGVFAGSVGMRCAIFGAKKDF